GEIAVDRVLRLEAREPDRLLHDELDRAGDHALGVGLVEPEAQRGEEVLLGAHVDVDQDADLHGREGKAVRWRLRWSFHRYGCCLRGHPRSPGVVEKLTQN